MSTILDLYDDPSASVLRGHLARTQGGLTEKLASFEPCDASALEALPDRLFALVGSSGGERLRKYAMHDEAHLATSILYFLECGGQLPGPVRAKVAQNLITACGWYEAAPPVALTKVAFLGALVNTGLTAATVPGKLREEKQKTLENDAAFRAAQMTGIKQAGRPVHVSDGEGEAPWHAIEKFLRGEETPERQYEAYGHDYPNVFADPQGLVKEANTAGTEVHSFGGLDNDPRAKTPAKRMAIAPKVSHWHEAGEFGFTVPEPEQRVPLHYALPHHALYPIDTPEEVKRASAYFGEYARDFPLEERRIFAQNVAVRAHELGVKVASTLESLGANTYGPHIVPELKGRIAALEGTAKAAAYEVLLEHLDETPPIVMVDMLKQADEDSGMDNGYGRPVTGFRDPLSAVFGAPEKPIYSWAGKGAYVTEEQLRSFSKLVPELDKVIEKDWSVKFIDDPVAAFDKLPDSKKLVVARLANGEAFRWI